MKRLPSRRRLSRQIGLWLAFAPLFAACQLFAPLGQQSAGGQEASPSVLQPIGADSTVVELHVTPAPLADPLLRYSLVIRDEDRVPGNASEVYLRALYSFSSSDTKKWWELFNRLAESDYEPSADLQSELEKWLAENEPLQGHIRMATHCRECSWELEVRPLKNFREAMEIRLDDVQGMRTLARILFARSIVEIERRDYDAACESITQLYQLGQDVGKTPILICNLVGAACIGMADELTEKLIAAPDSPNLYWALAELPDRPIDFSRSIRREMLLLTQGWRTLDEPENLSLSAAEWSRQLEADFVDLISAAGGAGGGAGSTGNPALSRLGMGAWTMMSYGRAKRELREEGFSAEEVEEMPAAQVVAIWQARHHRRAVDLVMSYTLMQPPQLFHELPNFSNRLEEMGIDLESGSASGGMLFPFMAMLMPSIESILPIEQRMARHRAALMNIEAIRYSMSQSDGAFPASWESLDQLVPVADSITLQPFPGAFAEDHVILDVQAPVGTHSQTYSRRFVIRHHDSSASVEATGESR